MLAANGLIEILARDVSLRLEEGLQNQLALSRLLQMILFEVGRKGLYLGFVGHLGSVSLLAGRFLRRPVLGSDLQARAGLFEQVLGPGRQIIIEIF